MKWPGKVLRIHFKEGQEIQNLWNKAWWNTKLKRLAG